MITQSEIDDLQARYAAACDLKQRIDRDKISAAFLGRGRSERQRKRG